MNFLANIMHISWSQKTNLHRLANAFDNIFHIIAVMNSCKICGKPTRYLFSKKILRKYDVSYFQCGSCAFVTTEEPFWLNESYSEAIADADTGVLQRNLKFKQIVPWIIKLHFNSRGRFIDYGAGYGIFVRLMRDAGCDFWWHDVYCANLFARKFDSRLLPIGSKYELLTAFEVFEHLARPKDAIVEMLQYADSILFSTTLINTTQDLESWWYLSPETGQHIAFFSSKTFKVIADELGLNFYTNGYNFHLLTKKKNFPRFVFWSSHFLQSKKVF